MNYDAIEEKWPESCLVPMVPNGISFHLHLNSDDQSDVKWNDKKYYASVWFRHEFSQLNGACVVILILRGLHNIGICISRVLVLSLSLSRVFSCCLFLDINVNSISSLFQRWNHLQCYASLRLCLLAHFTRFTTVTLQKAFHICPFFIFGNVFIWKFIGNSSLLLFNLCRVRCNT